MRLDKAEKVSEMRKNYFSRKIVASNVVNLSLGKGVIVYKHRRVTNL